MSTLSSRGAKRRGDPHSEQRRRIEITSSSLRRPRNDKQPLISVLIVTFNRWDLLERCLKAIDAQSYRTVEVIVVNNGNDRETSEGLKRFSSDRKRSASVEKGSRTEFTLPKPTAKEGSNTKCDLRYLKPDQNLGFAGGNNLAARVAKGEYLFLLNNDAFLGRNTLIDLLPYMNEHPEVTVVQPTILIGDSQFAIRNSQFSNGTGSFLTQWGFLWHRGLRVPLSELPTKPDQIFSALGAGILIRHDAVVRHGLFDESFFAYFEETDFCWRVWTRGGSVAYVSTDPMTHIGGQTSKAFNEKLVIFTAYRNRITSFWRHLEFWHLLQILTLHHLAILGVAAALIPKRPKASGWILAVILWELTHPLTLLKTRAQHMRRRTVPDAAIWPTIYRPVSLHQMLSYLR